MDRKFFAVIFLPLALLCAPARAADIDPFLKNEIAASLSRPRAPFVQDDYLVFTAAKTARFVGIAFGFENYKTIHPFERSVTRDDTGKEIDSILFYLLPLPQTSRIFEYRLIIDGLWTFDPSNAERVYVPEMNTLVSSVRIEREAPPVTTSLPPGTIRFVCEAPAGSQIRVAGSFNNWDSYMYFLTEIKPGVYQLDLPIPPGTYHYAFYRGTASFTDTSNPLRAYTNDGRIASVITVK